MLIDAPQTLLNTIIHKKHWSHFMAKTMNELAHKSPLILYDLNNLLRTAYSFAQTKLYIYWKTYPYIVRI